MFICFNDIFVVIEKEILAMFYFSFLSSSPKGHFFSQKTTNRLGPLNIYQGFP